MDSGYLPRKNSVFPSAGIWEERQEEGGGLGSQDTNCHLHLLVQEPRWQQKDWWSGAGVCPEAGEPAWQWLNALSRCALTTVLLSPHALCRWQIGNTINPTAFTEHLSLFSLPSGSLSVDPLPTVQPAPSSNALSRHITPLLRALPGCGMGLFSLPHHLVPSLPSCVAVSRLAKCMCLWVYILHRI